MAICICTQFLCHIIDVFAIYAMFAKNTAGKKWNEKMNRSYSIKIHLRLDAVELRSTPDLCAKTFKWHSVQKPLARTRQCYSFPCHYGWRCWLRGRTVFFSLHFRSSLFLQNDFFASCCCCRRRQCVYLRNNTFFCPFTIAELYFIHT